MKYVQPYGLTDPDSAYVNGNPAIGLTGFTPPAEAVEHKMRELVQCIYSAGIVPDSRDLEQFTKAIRSQFLNYYFDEGEPNALVVSNLTRPKITTLSRGLPLRVLVAFDNTGPSTITVDGIGPTFILRANGSNCGEADLRAGEIVELVYDGAYFQISNFMGYSADNETNNFYEFNIPYCADISVTANLINAPFNPVIAALHPGLTIEVKVANANTAATQIIVNSLPAVPVRIPSGTSLTFQELEPGQVAVGQIAIMIFDGIQFQLINPAKPQLASQIATPVQIVKLATYEDPNKHIVSLASFPAGGFYKTRMAIEQPIFEFDYAPVSIGNKIRIEVTGAVGYVQPRIDPSPCVLVYLSWATVKTGDLDPLDQLLIDWDYNPAVFPGLDYPNTGSLAANVGVLNFQRYPIVPYVITSSGQLAGNQRKNPNAVHYFGDPHSMEMNFKLLGQLVVPDGPPPLIHFRIAITAFPSYVQEAHGSNANDHIVHGGTIIQVTEFTR